MQPSLGLACARILKTPAPIPFLLCVCVHARIFLGSAGDGAGDRHPLFFLCPREKIAYENAWVPTTSTLQTVGSHEGR